MDTDNLVSVPRAAKRTSMSETTIRRGVMNGTIRGAKIGRDWFIPLAEVDLLAAEYPLEAVNA